ncbi:MAG: uroporphyrinogen decarboxylase family protein [Candidatus Marinimicrobia bacterium]|jgi:uroporphyrinogen decarboxylase|nr:uroporphyrinogen decarboxylase family protein [Candidatus Neomarinimicrobiota bacterium]MDX9777732.1 uroporphyrinogen decarboxylase family protein [bacterium]
MNGKKRILRTLRGKTVDKVPWVPFAGVHAGKLCGYSATEVLQDADKLFESLIKVHQTYLPDGMPVLFDLQLEAEILGCELMWGDDSPPSVLTHPLENDFRIPDKLPAENDGRIPLVLDVMRRMKSAVGKNTALYGLICGPLTLATHLRGSELFMDTYSDEEKVKELIHYCSKVAERMADMYIRAGMDVIAVVDPVISQISPEMFYQFLYHPLKAFFSSLKEQKVISSLFVCGDASRNLEPMCNTFPDILSIDENIDMRSAKILTDAHGIVIAGNIPLTTVMLLGTQQDNVRYITDFLTEMKSTNLIISPGCDMPYDTPPENVVGIMDAIRNPESAKKMLENYEAPASGTDISLPDYTNLDKPLIEVFTVDSAACAACAYLKDAAMRLLPVFGNAIEIREYKITEIENVARVKKMGVRNLPSIYLNGTLYSSSLIPRHDAFIAEIRRLLDTQGKK